MRTTNNTLKTALFTLALTSASFFALTGNVRAESGSVITTEASAVPFDKLTGGRATSEEEAVLTLPPVIDDEFARADLNHDGLYTIDDLVQLLTGWGACPAIDAPCLGDTNLDGLVDQADLVFLVRLMNQGA